MSSEPSGEAPAKGDEYVLPDGSTEIVFLVEDGRVLTVSEYDSVESFEASVSAGRFVGTRAEVAAMPGAEAFAESDAGTDDAED